MQKLKKLLVLLICIVLAGCSSPSNTFGSESRLTKEELNRIESEDQINSKTIPSESANTNNSNPKTGKEYTDRPLSKMEQKLLELYPIDLTDYKADYTEQQVLELLKKEYQLDYSVLSKVEVQRFYHENKYDIHFGWIKIPRQETERFLEVVESEAAQKAVNSPEMGWRHISESYYLDTDKYIANCSDRVLSYEYLQRIDSTYSTLKKLFVSINDTSESAAVYFYHQIIYRH